MESPGRGQGSSPEANRIASRKWRETNWLEWEGESHRALDCPEVLGEPATKDAKPGGSVIHEAVLTGASGRSADKGGREAGRGPGRTQWAFIMVGSGNPEEQTGLRADQRDSMRAGVGGRDVENEGGRR